MQSDLLFASHNPHSYPKRSSSDVSVCVETPCYQPTRQKHWGGGEPLLFFSLFSLLCVLCPLIKSVPDISCYQPLPSKSPSCWRSRHLSLSASRCDFQSHSPFNLHYTIHQTHLSEALFSSDSSWPQACTDHPESSCRIIPQLSLCHKVVLILSLRPMQRYLSEPPDLWPVTCAHARLGHTLQDWKPLLHTCISPQSPLPPILFELLHILQSSS